MRAAEKVIAAARIRAEEFSGTKPGRDPDVRCAFADSLEAQALAIIPAEMTERGVSGELLPVVERKPEWSIERELRSTLDKPSYVTAEASRQRLEGAFQADVLESALDLAETANAKNSVEKMLAAQMALLHKATMKLGKCLVDVTERGSGVIDSRMTEAMSVQTTRYANAFARCSAEFQGAALTLQKLKTGGRQVLTVQHVTVTDGGKAIVNQVTNQGPGPHSQGEC